MIEEMYSRFSLCDMHIYEPIMLALQKLYQILFIYLFICL